MKSSRRASILTVSDTRSNQTRSDETTPLIKEFLEQSGFDVVETAVVSDDVQIIQQQLIGMADRIGTGFVLTTGGTGFGPRDVTPEATKAVIDREVPGIPEALRAETSKQTALAWLSRGVAGLRAGTLIINLPGSPQAVKESLGVLLPLLPHALDMIRGTSHGSDAILVADS